MVVRAPHARRDAKFGTVADLDGMVETANIEYVLAKLEWLAAEWIWPNGQRYLWTDAFGVVLLVSLYHALGDKRYLDEAESLIAAVDAVLGRARGFRIGEQADRDGQYFHYLTKWIFALMVAGRFIPRYREQAITLARDIHPAFCIPGEGVIWKMREDLSGPYPGYGFGAIDAFDGYVVYSLLDAQALSREIADMRRLIEQTAMELTIHQDLGIGMMLWLSHFFPHEDWAVMQRARCLATLDHMWIRNSYFCREPFLPEVRFAFTNYGVAIGLQAAGEHAERVNYLHRFFDTYEAGDEYDRAAITHVMACSSHFPGYLIMRDQT
jgi:hypothetical protein